MSRTTDRRAFLVASTFGAVVSFAAFTWMLAATRFDFMVREQFGNFYDAQARALLHGHWNVSTTELAFEGFRIGDKTFTYFGPWPSILRMPFVQLAPSTYGRLTQLSMLLAFATMLVGVVALHWRIRDLLRGDAPIGRLDLIGAAAAPIALGCGSSAMFLAGRAWVYHEAILWGVAWALLAYERIIAFSRAPSGARLFGASAAATLAFSSRASVGLGPVFALGLVLLSQVVTALRQRRIPRSSPAAADPSETPDGRTATRWIPPTLAAVTAPILAYTYVNYARFGSLLSVPWRRQVLFSINADSRAPLDANNGTYFGIKYLPTTLLQYLRPDALARNSLLPWVTFPRGRPTVIGHTVMALDVSSSVTASMPALAILTIIGIVAALSVRFARTPNARLLRIPLLGAAVGTVLVLTIAFIAQRYLGDWLPLVAIGSLAGIHTLIARRAAAAPGRRRRVQTGILVTLAALVMVSVWINGSLALWFQRLDTPNPESLRAEFVATQYRVSKALGTGAPQTEFVATLPRHPASSGTTAIVGDCAALYWSDGQHWRLVGGTPAGGVFDLTAELPPLDAATWRPILTWATPAGPDVLALRRDREGLHVSRSLRLPGGTLTFTDREPPVKVTDGGPLAIQVVTAEPLGLFRVRINGTDAWQRNRAADLPSGVPVVGAAIAPGVAPTYGAIRVVPDRELCRAIHDAHAG
ncbi:MAG: hypothetical protein JJE46_05230 [Acidimicrobiia bacterium]|nr:hypothetical protein [Acidimicrobiia bacterium]